MAVATLYANKSTWCNYEYRSNSYVVTLNSTGTPQLSFYGTYDSDNGDYQDLQYIDFNWNDLPANVVINSAVLRLYGNSKSGNVQYKFSRITSGWSAGNRPDFTDGNALTGYTNTLAVNTYNDFNVTQLVRDMGNSRLGFRLAKADNTGEFGGFYYQGIAGANKPYLVVDYTIPNVSPNGPLLNTPTNGAWYNSPRPYFTWAFSDNDAGDYQSAFQIQVSADSNFASGWVGDTGYTPGSRQDWTWTHDLGDGVYYYRIRTWDSKGWEGPWSWVPVFGIDAGKPSVSITSPPNNHSQKDQNIVIYWEYTDNTAQKGFNIEIVNKEYTATIWSSGWRYETDRRSYVLPKMGDNISFFVRMSVMDQGGNISGPIESTNRFYSIDNTAPNIGSVSGQQYNSNIGNTTKIYAYNVTDNVSVVAVSVWLTRPDGSAYQIDNATYDGNWYTVVSWNGLMQGNWGIDFRGHDAAGNISAMARAYVYVDSTPPTIGSVAGDQNNRTANPQYTTTQANGSFRVWAKDVVDNGSGINRVQFPTCNYTQSGGATWLWFDGIREAGTNNWYCDIPINQFGNGEGEYLTDPYAFDNAGNQVQASQPRVRTFVDRTAPTITSVQGYSYTNQTSGNRRVWAYGIQDNLSGIFNVYCNYTPPGQATVNGVVGVQSGSDYYVDIPITGEGEYKVDFYCQDKSGNWMIGSKAAYFFVDSQRANDPNISVVWGLTDATFTWSEFSDPAPSSGRATTDFYLGEWNGSSWVGTPMFNGQDIGNVTSKYVPGLKQGTRYRFTVTYHDKAGNESSYTYREFMTKKKVGVYPVGGKNGSVILLSVYDPTSGVLGSKALRVGLKSGGVGCFELVSTTDPNASAYRISNKAISK
ncbi:DNRLRE domain-containing protein [Paenibacillus sp. UNC451MF]|uniref:DNRLRE domain-containing protein n=1 Tax=Paenibacillus sp. UNC451MF TaxID=1449063 RepID=UPI00048CA3D8|nr:DNRLRE domain-containing protein [Paenibacillus sp. UNC451MF]